MKNTLLFTYSTKFCGTFVNGKYEKLSYPKNQKICDSILVTLLKMQQIFMQKIFSEDYDKTWK